MIRKGTEQDIPHIAAIYEHIHDNEESGRSTVGWIRGVYPTADTARAALEADDLFVMEENGAVVQSVMLAVRPEDLTRTEPNRATVHQTLGRSVTGWLDDFGVGLPTCNISKHTK